MFCNSARYGVGYQHSGFWSRDSIVLKLTLYVWGMYLVWICKVPMVRCGWWLSWLPHRQGELGIMCWFMPVHKRDEWCVRLQRTYEDGRVELFIWLAVPIFDMFELIVFMTCTQARGVLLYACAQIWSTMWYFGVCDGSILDDAGIPTISWTDIIYIYISHTACKDEFRRNLRSHSWSVF